MREHLTSIHLGRESSLDTVSDRGEPALIVRDPSASRTLVDINELSRRLNIAKGTLYNWVYLRRIPFIKAGRCLRFDFEKVFEALSHCPKMEEAAKR